MTQSRQVPDTEAPTPRRRVVLRDDDRQLVLLCAMVCWRSGIVIAGPRRRRVYRAQQAAAADFRTRGPYATLPEADQATGDRPDVQTPRSRNGSSAKSLASMHLVRARLRAGRLLAARRRPRQRPNLSAHRLCAPTPGGFRLRRFRDIPYEAPPQSGAMAAERLVPAIVWTDHLARREREARLGAHRSAIMGAGAATQARRAMSAPGYPRRPSRSRRGWRLDPRHWQRRQSVSSASSICGEL